MKINFRPLVFLAVSMALGIFAGALLFDDEIPLIVLSSVSVVFFLVLIVFFRKKVIILVLVFGFILGLGVISLELKTKVQKENEFTRAEVSGRVAELYSGKVKLENLVIDGEKRRGCAVLSFDGELAVGNEITAVCRGKTLGFDVLSGVDFYNSEDIWYEFYPNGYVRISEGKKTFFERGKDRLLAPMKEYLPEADAGIAEALVLGDKEGMSYFDRQAATYAGVSHIFAVSGLHVGFCVSVLYFLFKKLRINRIIAFALTAIVLFLYAGITCFSPSVIRASVMALIASASVLLKRRNDPLSTLSLAVIILLLIKPSNLLFSVSYLMSVSAVLGIILFYRPIYGFLVKENKSRTVRFLSGSVAMTVSANSILLPVSFYFFGGIATYSVISNFLVIPLVTVTYVLIMLIAVISLIIPSAGILYQFFGVLLSVIRIITEWIASFPYPVFGKEGSIVFGCLYTACAFLSSRFVIMEKKRKVLMVSGLGILALILFFAL